MVTFTDFLCQTHCDLMHYNCTRTRTRNMYLEINDAFNQKVLREWSIDGTIRSQPPEICMVNVSTLTLANFLSAITKNVHLIWFGLYNYEIITMRPIVITFDALSNKAETMQRLSHLCIIVKREHEHIDRYTNLCILNCASHSQSIGNIVNSIRNFQFEFCLTL